MLKSRRVMLANDDELFACVIQAKFICNQYNLIKVYGFLFINFCINGVSGFGPVPRSTIAVEGKGQIRDWPKKAPYHTGD